MSIGLVVLYSKAGCMPRKTSGSCWREFVPLTCGLNIHAINSLFSFIWLPYFSPEGISVSSGRSKTFFIINLNKYMK